MGLVTNSNLNVDSLPGIWRSRRWYPNTKHESRTDTSEHYVRIDRAANGFVIHSLPDKSGSYLQAHFEMDTNLATGTYIEDTSPKGEWIGMAYKGGFQLIVSDDLKHMSGGWVGVGYNNGNPKIFADRWELEYAGEALDGLPELYS